MSNLVTSPSQFLFYAGQDGKIKIQVIVQDETVWASQQAIAEIFDVGRTTITEHLKNIFESNELDENSVCRKIRHTAADGKAYNTKFYNLDAIISVGYRVNSKQATQFRIWANSVLKEYLIKGFALDDERLKQGNQLFGEDYFEKLLERIREIRASERRFYQKITDLYAASSSDYDPKSEITKTFYATVQNKFHFAIHGHTASELICARADATLPNMGLTSWRDEKIGGKIHKSDVPVAKNYLSEAEISELNLLVSQYLDFAENMAKRRKVMTMKEWAKRLDDFLTLNEYSILPDAGSISQAQAKAHAESEYAKFRVIQDQNYQSDFDRAVEQVKKLNQK